MDISAFNLRAKYVPYQYTFYQKNKEIYKFNKGD